MTESCATCRFGHTIEEIRYCRFDPPEFVPPNGSQIKPVRADGWCGKWQKSVSATVSVPAPGSDPNTERSSNLSVLRKPKKSVAATL